MESTLLQHEVLWIGAGSTVHMAAIAPGDLQRLARARTADLVPRG
jgi:prolyl-tRNA editing enzyme YbaK/EbsC (Cys-tRNA(Pro) deacylase)